MSGRYNIVKEFIVKPAAKAVKNLVKGGKQKTTGTEVIKSLPPNVPDTKLKKAQSKLDIASGKLKGKTAELNQTMFESKHGVPFTFGKSSKKTMSNTERAQKAEFRKKEKKQENKTKHFYAPENFNKGGRVGYRLGSPKKSKLKKIQEAFKTTPSFMTVKKEKPKKRLMAKKGSPDPKKKKKFPDLTGDGKVTFADILKGRGVINGKKKKTKKKII